ncbi:MAG: restriction endonuclease [Actinobacteria bacterium]|nr:restriction endonuclease [Actinomycetota bacterium]
MAKPVEDLLPEKPQARLRIYAYSIEDDDHAGLLKIGQTTQDVKTRVGQQLKTAAIKNFTIQVDESGEREDGSTFSDHMVRDRLKAKGFINTELEWMACTVADVTTVLNELRTGQAYTGSHHETFPPRPEQRAAVDKAHAYFQSIWAEDENAVPRFLWNAKMRFGKTFATYQLAKKLGAHKVLVVTFKPAVEDAWQTDLESHVDFTGWQYRSKATGDPTTADKSQPLVYFGSFQDLLGKDKLGNIKAKNAWLHEINWELVVFDEYHFGAWRDSAKELFEGEDVSEAKQEAAAEYNPELDAFNEELDELGESEVEFLPITTKAYLYLSGTPFRALATGEFIEEQIFNWTYTDEQRAKQQWAQDHPGAWNPYGGLPEMRLLTYQMPEELLAIAAQGEFDEFDLNEFFAASGVGTSAVFKHKDEVQKWLDIIRGAYSATQVDNLKLGAKKPPFPYSDVRLLPYLNHSFWFLPSVASCQAMANLLAEKQNTFFHGYKVLSVAGAGAGVGLAALPPVRTAIGNGHDTKTITLSCGKLTTGVTVAQWSSILMLRNLNSPETYFQAAFRVQSPWSIKNPNGDDPNLEVSLKPVCYVFDFAPTRALRQIADYGAGLSPEVANPEDAVKDLVNFLPVLAYDGSHMTALDAAAILDTAMTGTSATLLARKWESALLVNVDNATLRKILDNPDAMAAVMRIEGFRALGSDVFETVINKSEKVKDAKKSKGEDISPAEKRELTAEEKEYKSKRKQIQDKLIKFATRIPAFMYLTDFRENTLKDVITKLEPELFRTVTGLSVADFHLLVSLNVFNSTHMNQAVFAFRRYEDASLSYTGIDSHEGLSHFGLYDTVVARET